MYFVDRMHIQTTVRILVILQCIGLIGSVNISEACPSTCACVSRDGDFMVNCTNKLLTTVPANLPRNTTVLILSSNRIKILPDNAFYNLSRLKELDLSNNRDLLVIRENSFCGLHNLKLLNLRNVDGISFTCDSSSQPFRHVTNLESLIMRDIDTFDPDCINSAFQTLTNIRFLSITWPSSPLPDGFSRLRKLNTLDLSHSTLDVIPETFKVLSNINITRLALRSLGINKFSPLALKDVARYLKVLDFSCNNEFTDHDMRSGYFSPILPSLENSSLHTLILDRCFDIDKAVVLTANQFLPLKKVPLKYLSIQQNTITILDPFLRHLRHLEYINMNYNLPMIIAGSRGKFIFDLLANRNLKAIEFSHQFLFSTVKNFCGDYESPLFWHDYKTSKSGKEANVQTTSALRLDTFSGSNKIVVKSHIPVQNVSITNIGFAVPPITVEGKVVYTVNVSDFTRDGVHYVVTNNLTRLDLSSNYVTSIGFVIRGFDSLKFFNLSNNNLEFITPLFFRAILNVEQLLLSKNRLGLRTSNTDLVTLFSNLKKLKFIDLSENGLINIPLGMFNNCPNLRTILLQGNKIKVLGLKFDALTSVKFIDLSSNAVKGFSEEQVGYLRKSDIIMKMTNNSGVECTCDNIPFIEWIQSDNSSLTIQDKQDIRCDSEDETRLVDVDLYSLHLSCIKNVIIITVTVAFSVIVMVVSTLWHFRWNLKYWIYVFRIKRRLDTAADYTERYDVYLSYTTVDYTLADKVFRTLEQNGLSVFFRDRDTLLGGNEYEEFVRGIEASRKIVLCMTENFLDCGDRDFEIRMSLVRGKGFIIPVVVDNISVEKLSSPLRNLLRDDVYFEWPTTNAEESTFWKNLKKAVMTKKGVCIRKQGSVIYYA